MTEMNQPPTMNTGEPQGMPNLPTGGTAPQQNPTTGTPGAALTDDEKQRVRSAAMMAGALVSGAEPGFFDAFKESMAAGKALQSASPEIQDIMKVGGLPTMPKVEDKSQMETAVLSELTGAKQLLAAKSPATAEAFKAFVLQSCRDVADAAKGVSGAEQGVIAKVEQALA
ncbi:hypothetical protein [Mariniluteicoccus flavus]